MRISSFDVVVTVAVTLLIGSGINAQTVAQPEATTWSAPTGSGRQMPTGVPTESRSSAMDSAERKAMARSIVERNESASGRVFDGAYRDAVVMNLATKPVTELEGVPRDTSHGLQAAPLFLGATQADLVYNPVAPCRVVDTRLIGGPITAGNHRAFRVTGTNFMAQGGSSGNCGVPFGPSTAAVINFTAVGATAAGPGNLAVVPYGAAFSSSSVINWTPGVNIANGLPVTLCDPNTATCTADIDVQANINSVNVVADVQGYFAAPVKTGLDVQVVIANYYSCPSAFDCGVTQPCNAGYIITGGGCQLANYSFTFYWANNSPMGVTNGWNCQGTNTSVNAQSMRTIAVCSRTPGR